MATIVSPQDFIGMVMLPQVNAPVNIGVSIEFPVKTSIQLLIDEKEPEVLTKLLGYGFYKQFAAGLAAGTIDQKWLDLRDGAEYTDSHGHLQKYTGIKSVITRYVYYWYLRQQATNTTGVGESKNETENAVRISPDQKMATAWNDMVKYVRGCYAYLHNTTNVYPEATEFVYHRGGSFDRYLYGGYYQYWRRCELLTVINVLSL